MPDVPVCDTVFLLGSGIGANSWVPVIAGVHEFYPHAQREGRFPTRGEFLVEHPGAGAVTVRVVLTLKPPFVVWIR